MLWALYLAQGCKYRVVKDLSLLDISAFLRRDTGVEKAGKLSASNPLLLTLTFYSKRVFISRFSLNKDSNPPD